MPIGKAGALVLAGLTFLGALAVLAPALFFAAIFVAGPHSDVLPRLLQPVALAGAWLTLIGVPTWLALRVFRLLSSERR